MTVLLDILKDMHRPTNIPQTFGDLIERDKLGNISGACALGIAAINYASRNEHIDDFDDAEFFQTAIAEEVREDDNGEDDDWGDRFVDRATTLNDDSHISTHDIAHLLEAEFADYLQEEIDGL